MGAKGNYSAESEKLWKKVEYLLLKKKMNENREIKVSTKYMRVSEDGEWEKNMAGNVESREGEIEID